MFNDIEYSKRWGWFLHRAAVRLFNLTMIFLLLVWALLDAALRTFGGNGRRRRNLEWKDERLSGMPKMRLAAIGGIAVTSFAMMTSGAIAGEDVNHVEARRLQAAGEILSFERISEVARSFKPGEILEVELERNRKSGIYIYEIEILDASGVVWEIDVNAGNGELIKMEIDD